MPRAAGAGQAVEPHARDDREHALVHAEHGRAERDLHDHRGDPAREPGRDEDRHVAAAEQGLVPEPSFIECELRLCPTLF